MIEIQRIYNRKKRSFKIYPKSEAKMKYIYWKEADIGEWALTDDGYMCECLDRKTYTDKNGGTKTYVKLSGGVGWVAPSSKIQFEVNHAYNTYTKTKPEKNWDDYEVTSTRGKNTISTYAQMMLNGGVDMGKLAKVYRPDDKIPEATVRRFLKQKKVKMAIEKKVKEILSEKSINKEFAIDNLLVALDMAQHKGDVGNFLKANDMVMDLLEMKPNKLITTDSVELIDTTKILDTITAEEKKMKLQRKEERDEPRE